MQTYTLEQSKKIYQDAKSKGLDGKKVIYLMAKDGAVFDGVNMQGVLDYGKQNYEPKPTLKTDIGSDIKETGTGIVDVLKERGGKIKESFQASKAGEQTLGESIGQTAVNVVRTPFDIAGEIIKGGVKGVLSQEQEEKLKSGVGELVGKGIETVSDWSSKYENLKQTNPTLAGGINIVLGRAPETVLDATEAYKQYQELKQTNPRAARNLEALFGVAETALDVATLGVGKVGVTAGKEAIEQGIKVAGKEFAEQGAKIGAKVATGARAVGSSVEPVKAVAESVASTIGGAVKRGKEAVVEGVQEAQRVANLPQAEKIAARSGLDQGVIDFVKTSSKESVPVYEKIITAAKTGGLRNGTAAKEVVGKEILTRAVNPAIKLRDTVGKKLGAVVEKLPTSKESIADSVEEFKNILNSVGVKVGAKGKLIAGRGAVTGDLPAYQNMFNRIKQGSASQRELHKIRSAVFKEFDLAKSRQAPFSGDAERVAEQFRSILGKKITNKNYLKLSKQYSEVMQPLQDFVKLIGYKGDIEKIGTKNLKVAEVAQRVLGNAASRPKEVLESIAKLAEKSGKGKLAKDLTDQIRFSDLMEDFYGIGQTRSMAGQTARGVKAGVEGATEGLVESASQGGITGIAAKVVKGVLGKTTKEQQKALEELIKSLR